MITDEFIDLSRYLQNFSITHRMVSRFLFSNNIAIFIMLSHFKGKEWPQNKKSFKFEVIKNIPLVWALFYSKTTDNVQMNFDIHPTKCFPSEYILNNPNFKKFPISKEVGPFGILAGCQRYEINIANNSYSIKAPKYCSIFGLPDDCYNPNFEEQMLQYLKTIKSDIWCFEETDYINSIIGKSSVKMQFIKQDFLPSKYFFYVDQSIKFLKGIYSEKELLPLYEVPWYSNGRDFINKRTLDNKLIESRFEDQSILIIKNKLIFEFLRDIILIMNKDSLKNYSIRNIPDLNSNCRIKIKNFTHGIVNQISIEGKKELNFLMQNIIKSIDKKSFNRSRFLVLDAEFIHVVYPLKNSTRTFNFPCIFSSIIWRGNKEKFDIVINSLNLPCHCCKTICNNFKNKIFSFECLLFAQPFIESQLNLMEEFLAEYENFKIYSYGKSDIFQLEQGDTFFTNSFEHREFYRQNRKRERRLTAISEDLSVISKRLSDIESEYIKNWLQGWTRKYPHINVNRNFMTSFTSKNFQKNFTDSINACLYDSIVAFLYLLHKKFLLIENPIEISQRTLDDW